MWFKKSVAISLFIPFVYAGGITHCTPNEEVIFSCSTGKKIVSVCGNKHKLVYRFGKVDFPELVFESLNPTGDTLMYSGGGGAYLRLSNGEYRYVVYSGIGKGWEKDGLTLEKNGKLLKDFQCKSKIQIELSDALFIRYHIKSDSGFEIP